MPSSSKIEEKSVQFSELKAGLQLRAGHSVLIIVGDGKGNPRYRKLAQHWDEDGSGGDAEPSDPPGTQGGVPDGKFEIHMQLHAANLAIAAGADIHEIAQVRDRLAELLKVEKHINLSHARQILESIRVTEQSPALL